MRSRTTPPRWQTPPRSTCPITTFRSSVTPPRRGQTDFSTIIQKIKSFGADWVYFADEGPETAPFVTQLKQAGLTIGQNINFLGTDGEEDPSIISKSQGAYDGAYATNITADPAGRRFGGRLRDRVQERVRRGFDLAGRALLRLSLRGGPGAPPGDRQRAGQEWKDLAERT